MKTCVTNSVSQSVSLKYDHFVHENEVFFGTILWFSSLNFRWILLKDRLINNPNLTRKLKWNFSYTFLSYCCANSQRKWFRRHVTNIGQNRFYIDDFMKLRLRAAFMFLFVGKKKFGKFWLFFRTYLLPKSLGAPIWPI